MGQGQLKQYRRALRSAAKDEKSRIVSQYVADNSAKVVAASVLMIRRFGFGDRFRIAMRILFRPIKKDKTPKQATDRADTG